jgi:hypothetical protein
VFIKLHTHAMQNQKSFLGAPTDETLAAMEYWWTRPPFRLHYVTAREAYNIAKAAEAGHSGDPNNFRDYLLPPPANRVVSCSSPWRLRSYLHNRICLEVLERRPTRIEFGEGSLRGITGNIREVEATYQDGALANLRVEADGPVAVDPPRYAPSGSSERACTCAAIVM